MNYSKHVISNTLLLDFSEENSFCENLEHTINFKTSDLESITNIEVRTVLTPIKIDLSSIRYDILINVKKATNSSIECISWCLNEFKGRLLFLIDAESLKLIESLKNKLGDFTEVVIIYSVENPSTEPPLVLNWPAATVILGSNLYEKSISIKINLLECKFLVLKNKPILEINPSETPAFFQRRAIWIYEIKGTCKKIFFNTAEEFFRYNPIFYESFNRFIQDNNCYVAINMPKDYERNIHLERTLIKKLFELLGSNRGEKEVKFSNEFEINNFYWAVYKKFKDYVLERGKYPPEIWIEDWIFDLSP